MRINQYYHRGVTLPQAGEIRELVDKRTGKVQHLGRVSKVDKSTRQAEIKIMELDHKGRERKR
jgi:hypothetical protein